MATTQHHIIRQQFLHVEVFGTESDGLNLQRRLPDVCRLSLTPALEKSLGRAVPAQGHLTIERLDVDAGTLNLDTLEHDLVEAVSRAIEKQLQRLMSPAEFRQDLQPVNIAQKSEEHYIQEAFVFFLNTGGLPWWFHFTDGLTFEQAILRSWQQGIQPKTSQRNFKVDIVNALASVTAQKRLVTQFSSDFLECFLDILSPQSLETIHEVFLRSDNTGDVRLDPSPTMNKSTDKFFPQSGKPLLASSERKYFIRQLWQTVFASLSKGKSQTALSLVAETWSLMQANERQQPGLREWVEHHWPRATMSTEAQGSKGLAKRMGNFSPSEEKTPPPIKDNASSSEAAATKKAQVPRPSAMHSGQLDMIEGVYVDCAGVVLLHPFLPRFFETLGIAANGKILQPDRALCLLHFLATGQDIAPEYALILPKLLCNVPLETTVEADVGITAAEKEESNALLEAIIGHWDALRSTSPDGLRGTFLVRPGKLSERNDGDHLLQVESQAFDILLDRLPWGIGVIKLPWMERMLWVEWEH